MIPVAYQASAKFRPQHRSCFHCGTRLSRRHSQNKMSCLECEDLVTLAVGRGNYHVKKAIQEGRLAPARECTCVDCGKPAICYDHRDYSQPLLVAPVCKSCNNKRGPGHLGVQL